MDLNTAGPMVLDMLQRASSQDTAVLKPAEQQLQDCERKPGFYSILLTIALDHTVDHSVRWLAVLYFKNGMDRYWRKCAPNSLSEEEKTSLRSKLISQFNEPVPQIATQMAVLVAKLARIDCPRHWPELIPVLLEAVKCDDSFVQHRALLTLHHVVKALASKRLATDRSTFEELTSNVFDYILNLWDSHCSRFFHVISLLETSTAMICIDHTILSLKVLRKLSVFGMKKFEETESAINFTKQVFRRVEEFLKSKKLILDTSRELGPKREKTITLLTKVLLDIQEHHPQAYMQFIRPSLELCVAYNFTEQGNDLLFERFTVNLFNLMRSILRCEMYRPAKNIEDTKNPLTLEAHKIKTDFFTPDTLREVCCRLIGHYFLLTLDDLQNWDSSPEDYMCEEGGDSWKFSLRPCTENLYMTLVKEFRQILTPVIVELVQQHLADVDNEDLQAILKKDAVYNAVGQASFDLYDEIDFDGWFQSHLVPQLQNKHPNFRVLRRRVIWLIGCWVGVKFSPSLQPVLYQALIPLLQTEEDLVVRMEAAFTLKIAVDDFEFKTEHFLPYLETSFGMLFQLLKDVNECETKRASRRDAQEGKQREAGSFTGCYTRVRKMQILHVMSFIIERMQVEIRPYAGSLIQYLPMLWQESADHNMLRCAILCTLTSLVQGLGPQCTTLFDFLLPVLQMSTDVKEEPHVYLYEDGLELWLNTMVCTPNLTPQLLDIYSNMSDLLEFGSETLRTCLKIIEAYVLLDPKQFLQKYAEILVKDLSSLLTDLKIEGIVLVYQLMETIFRVSAEDASQIFSSMFPEMMRTFVESQDYPMVTSMYITLFSRLILQSESHFWQLCEIMGSKLNLKNEEVLAAFLDCWLEKLDNIIQPDRRKLSAMALSSLFKSNYNAVLERTGGIINACVETLHDLYKIDPETELEQQLDCLVIGGVEPLPDDEEESAHDKRKRMLSHHDPVHTINLRSFLGTRLAELQQQQGKDNFDKLMSLVDPDIMMQLQRFIK